MADCIKVNRQSQQGFIGGTIVPGVYASRSGAIVWVIIRLYDNYSEGSKDKNGSNARYVFVSPSDCVSYMTHTYKSALDNIMSEGLVRVSNAELVI
jgi:hypothetical protein